MKVLMTIPYFVPAWGYGGPLQACFLLSKKLVEQGHRVTVLTTDTLDLRQRIEKREENIEGIEVVRFPNVSNRLAKKMNAFIPVGMGPWIKTHIRQFDVVHCHDFFLYSNIQVCKWATREAVPFIIQPHGSAVPKAERGRTMIKKAFNLFWGKGILRRAKAVIALTEAEAKDLHEYLPEVKIKILPNGLDISSVPRTDEWPYGKYGIAPGAPVIISVGRLHPVKGFDLLLDSFILLRRMLPEARLCIVGPDEGILAELKAKAVAAGVHEQVVFTGLVVGDVKEKLLAAASLFALFSRDEPFPVAALEGAARGLPLLLSRNIGIASQVTETGVGEAIDPQDSKQAAITMREMLRPEILDAYKKNLHRFLEPYSIDRIALSAVNLYREAISGH